MHIESAVYQVSEDVGSVDVCAVIQSPPGVECPVEFSISVTISTSDGSAGIYLTMTEIYVSVHVHIYHYSSSLYLWLVSKCHVTNIKYMYHY